MRSDKELMVGVAKEIGKSDTAKGGISTGLIVAGGGVLAIGGLAALIPLLNIYGVALVLLGVGAFMKFKG